MARTMARRFPIVAAMLAVVAGGSFGTRGTTLAQGAPFDCAPAAAPAATPVAVESADPVAFPKEGGELTVFAAASLTDAFEEIGETLEAENDGLAITYNFAGSQALVTQLDEGAEADVFASANRAQMEAAIENGSVAAKPAIFARNRLAIVVPSDNPGRVATSGDLADGGLRLVLAQPEVPVGRYAREAVCAMAEEVAAYGEGFADRVAGNVVSTEEDVREVLTKVRLGEADAGVVYVSDAATAADEVVLIEIPDAVNVVATYPIAPVAEGDAALAGAFIGYLLGAEGQATLEEYGFEPVG